MSLVLVYFETKNKFSNHYGGFHEVGQFDIPKEIAAGMMDVFYREKNCVVALSLILKNVCE